ncbi:MAG: hypothetical protein PWQ61_3519 [Betaproteobacteria bacterium]|nr:hypothetical protein [Betaproteobacteria bacterium]
MRAHTSRSGVLSFLPIPPGQGPGAARCRPQAAAPGSPLGGRPGGFSFHPRVWVGCCSGDWCKRRLAGLVGLGAAFLQAGALALAVGLLAGLVIGGCSWGLALVPNPSHAAPWRAAR